MPYIDRRRRQEINAGGDKPQTAGELNYAVTLLCVEYLGRQFQISADDRLVLSYARINEVVGVLECAKQELYRRVAVPYEDAARERNGEVYR